MQLPFPFRDGSFRACFESLFCRLFVIGCQAEKGNSAFLELQDFSDTHDMAMTCCDLSLPSLVLRFRFSGHFFLCPSAKAQFETWCGGSFKFGMCAFVFILISKILASGLHGLFC